MNEANGGEVSEGYEWSCTRPIQKRKEISLEGLRRRGVERRLKEVSRNCCDDLNLARS